ncbi:hypothetical protein D3C78_1444210 [compost metagenome]
MIIIQLGGHANRFKRVVHEVRINLVLQRIQLRFLLLRLHHINILNELINPNNHSIELLAQQAYLITVFHRKLYVKITFLHVLHQTHHFAQ